MAADLHAANLLDADHRNWTYLSYGPFARLDDYLDWVRSVAGKDDPQFHAIVDRATDHAVGVASYLRIDPDGRIDRGRPHQLLAPAAADGRGDRSDVPDDAPRLRARLPPV